MKEKGCKYLARIDWLKQDDPTVSMKLKVLLIMGETIDMILPEIDQISNWYDKYKNVHSVCDLRNESMKKEVY